MTAGMLAHYSAALDEIYRLRTALAYEAEAIAAHLSYATFPKSRREIAEKQIERMHAAAAGDAQKAYTEVPHWAQEGVRQAVGVPLLTRETWESGR